MLCVVASLGGTQPLDASQRARIAEAADESQSIDEAAFYALLENARSWTDVAGQSIDSGEEPLIVPNYGKLRQSPQESRGGLFQIEGRFIKKLPVEGLKRGGWESVEAVVIQVGDLNKSLGDLTADDMILVYLLSPPATTDPVLNARNLPEQTGSPIRLAARFYKVLSDRNRQGKTTQYLAFVGQRVQGELTVNRSSPVPTAVMFGIILALLGGYIVLQVRSRRNRKDWNSDRLARARQRIAAAHSEPQLDLPKDPAAALEVLPTIDDPTASADDSPEASAGALDGLHRTNDPAAALDALTHQNPSGKDD